MKTLRRHGAVWVGEDGTYFADDDGRLYRFATGECYDIVERKGDDEVVVE